MTPLMMRLVVFACFGIYGAMSDHATTRARRRKALRDTLEQLPVDRSRRSARTERPAEEGRTPR